MQGQWIPLEKYTAYNLPPWSKDLKPKEKARLMKDLNNWLGDEKQKRDVFFKDLDAIRKAAKDIRDGEPHFPNSPSKLTRLVEKMMRKSGVSYLDGRNASECVYIGGIMECCQAKIFSKDLRITLQEILNLSFLAASKEPSEILVGK